MVPGTMNKLSVIEVLRPALHFTISKRLFSKGLVSSRLFVGGLSYDTNETVLKDFFGEYGEVIEVKVICDRWTGKSKGFGFVQFTSEIEANRAREQMDGQSLEGRNIRVSAFQNKG